MWFRNVQRERGAALQICGGTTVLDVLSVPLRKAKRKWGNETSSFFSLFLTSLVRLWAPLCFQRKTLSKHNSRGALQSSRVSLLMKIRNLGVQDFHTTVNGLAGQVSNSPCSSWNSSNMVKWLLLREKDFLPKMLMNKAFLQGFCGLNSSILYSQSTPLQVSLTRRGDGGRYLWVSQRGRHCGPWGFSGYVCVRQTDKYPGIMLREPLIKSITHCQSVTICIVHFSSCFKHICFLSFSFDISTLSNPSQRTSALHHH